MIVSLVYCMSMYMCFVQLSITLLMLLIMFGGNKASIYLARISGQAPQSPADRGLVVAR